MRRNLTIDRDSIGIYATDHFSRETETIVQHHNLDRPLFLLVNHLAPHAGNYDDPLQAPEEEILKFHYIDDKKRRTLAGEYLKFSWKTDFNSCLPPPPSSNDFDVRQ
jgi:arylsulfatase B